MTADLRPKTTRTAIKNEAGNGLSNGRGTLAMARTNVIDSATSQFFINTVNNSRSLDHKGNDPQGYGYAVFGKVTDGMNIVDKIAAVQTRAQSGHNDVPVVPVVINGVTAK